MVKVLDKRLILQILSIVEQIPVGKVATYGQIAHLIGRERNARLVGRCLKQNFMENFLATVWLMQQDA